MSWWEKHTFPLLWPWRTANCNCLIFLSKWTLTERGLVCTSSLKWLPWPLTNSVLIDIWLNQCPLPLRVGQLRCILAPWHKALKSITQAKLVERGLLFSKPTRPPHMQEIWHWPGCSLSLTSDIEVSHWWTKNRKTDHTLLSPPDCPWLTASRSDTYHRRRFTAETIGYTHLVADPGGQTLFLLLFSHFIEGKEALLSLESSKI